jgi:hypothetical protein
MSVSSGREINVAGRIVINAILDSGSEVDLLSERVYEKLTQAGVDIPVLPVEHVLMQLLGSARRELNKKP